MIRFVHVECYFRRVPQNQSTFLQLLFLSLWFGWCSGGGLLLMVLVRKV